MGDQERKGYQDPTTNSYRILAEPTDNGAASHDAFGFPTGKADSPVSRQQRDAASILKMQLDLIPVLGRAKTETIDGLRKSAFQRITNLLGSCDYIGYSEDGAEFYFDENGRLIDNPELEGKTVISLPYR